MADDDKNIFNMDTFTKLMKAAEDSSDFESHKTIFLYDFHLSLQ